MHNDLQKLLIIIIELWKSFRIIKRVKRNSYFSVKIKNHVQDTSVGLYKIPCTGWDLAYIGETGKSLRIRLKQHESNCRNNSNPSAVVNYHKLWHFIDFENSCVIYPESYDKTKNSWVIIRDASFMRVTYSHIFWN